MSSQSDGKTKKNGPDSLLLRECGIRTVLSLRNKPAALKLSAYREFALQSGGRLLVGFGGLLRSLLFFHNSFLVVEGSERIDCGLFGRFRHFLFNFLLRRCGFAFRERFVESLSFTLETFCQLLRLMRLMIGKTRTGRLFPGRKQPK